jgi:NAD(P)-dependent dehydrogenase (short-subunit alcohol dehydrogenase family)
MPLVIMCVHLAILARVRPARWDRAGPAARCPARFLIGATGGRGYAHALATGYLPAMIVMVPRSGLRRSGASQDSRGGGVMTRAPELAGQTVVVIGGSAGMGLETARRAREEGAEVILTGRNAEHLNQAAAEVGARQVAAFDVTDFDALDRFFAGLPGPIDHLLLTGPGPYYAPLAELDFTRALRTLDTHLLLPLRIGRNAVGRVRPGGTLLFVSGTGARRPAKGQTVAAIGTAGLAALVANLALELAPVRVNLIAAGFVDTPLSARLLGDDLDARRAQLRATLPIGRVIEPTDIAALAVHLMANTAVTGATYDIDGGQQLV